MDSALPGAQSSGAGDVSPGGTGPGHATNPKMRKRTKTGCLTCRKRRIKCGEERPTCANCIKSKRQCEGYNQRVVFKPPIGDWPNHPGVVSTLQYHNSMLPGSRSGYRGTTPSSQSQDSSLSSIQPRPLTQFTFSNVESGSVPSLEHLNTQQVLVGGPSPYHQDPSHQQPLHSPHHQPQLHSPHHQLPTPTSATSYFPSQPSPAHASFPGSYAPDGTVNYEMQQRYSQAGQYQQVPVSYETPMNQKPLATQSPHEQTMYQHAQRPASISEEQSSYTLQSYAPQRADSYTQHTEQRPSLSRYGSNPQIPVQQSQNSRVDFSQGSQYAPLSATTYSDSTHSAFQPVQIPHHDVNPYVNDVPQHAPVLGMSRV